MNCIYCNKQITNRKKGDHLIPQGLGKFSPEITVFHTCRDCDSENGNTFERIVLRTGVFGVFRPTKGIKSKNNKNLPIHSPSLDKFRAIESQKFAITNISKPDESVYVSSKGEMKFANQILIKKNDILIDSINIPITRNIQEICNFIKDNIPENQNDLECELALCPEQMEEILKELSRRDIIFEEPYMKKSQREVQILRISSIITENHFRFVTSIVLKGMIYLGYSTCLLCHMIDYVKTGDTKNLIYGYVDHQESGTNALDDPSLKLFYHLFEWRITENSIKIIASLLAHKNVNGIRIKVSLKSGNDTSIIIPFGKIVARYGETPNDGILEIFHGNNKVV
jgi:hypothetical protein